VHEGKGVVVIHHLPTGGRRQVLLEDHEIEGVERGANGSNFPFGQKKRVDWGRKNSFGDRRVLIYVRI